MRMRMIIGYISICILGVSCTLLTTDAVAEEALQTFAEPDQFLADTFETAIPDAKTLWPNSELRKSLADILGHRPSLRFKYWQADGKTAWILDEVGKDRPITAGVVIKQGKIDDIQVLVFRESRGWEIKYDFFTRQFANLWLDKKHKLSGGIDNITGATLSVKAMTRMAKAALLLDEHTRRETPTLAHAR